MEKGDFFIISGNKRRIYIAYDILVDNHGNRFIVYPFKKELTSAPESDCKVVKIEDIKVRDFKGGYWYKLDEENLCFLGSDLKPDFLCIKLEDYLNKDIKVINYI